MTATLTLDLFRPSILDPVEDTEAPALREPGSDREANDLQLRGPGFARDREPERIPAPAVPVGGDLQAHQPMAQQGGGPTLDDLVVGVWEGLAAHRTVACLACGEAMTPRYSAGPAPVGGRCRSCGTTIS